MKNPEPSKYSGKALLKDKKCVVTGGALGIGRQICYTFAENEAEVIILDYNIEAAEDAKAVINKAFKDSKIHVVQGDVSNRTNLKKSFAEIASIFDGSTPGTNRISNAIGSIWATCHCFGRRNLSNVAVLKSGWIIQTDKS